MSLVTGTRLGPYEIISALGAGGMGEVYRARDTRLDRDVALKILPDSFAGDSDRLMRFEREAKTLASLNHPNIAAIYGLESAGGQRALVMELVESEDLSARIARGAMSPADSLPIGRDHDVTGVDGDGPPGGEPREWLATGAEEGSGKFSPDGRVVTYVSNASGRSEVYIQSRGSATDRQQVSAAGGTRPVWAPRGDRLFFRQGNLMMETIVSTAGALSASVPARVFDGGWTLSESFDVMPNGQRFLMMQKPPDEVTSRLEVVLNWFTMLQDKVGRR